MIPTLGKIKMDETKTIAYVPQEVDEGLVQGLTVIENLLLSIHYKNKKFLFSKKKSIEIANQTLSKWNVSLIKR